MKRCYAHRRKAQGCGGKDSGEKGECLHVEGELWDGVADPYLYTVKAELSVGGKAVDEISTTCGVRYFKFDPDKGFFLNGRPYNLHGVSRHQDFKGIGNAITKEHHDKDMELIREIGANTVRLAHYQHDQYFYDLCDKYGMVVWAEIPYISEHLANGDANTESQMKELIIHVSLCGDYPMKSPFPADPRKNRCWKIIADYRRW